MRDNITTRRNVMRQLGTGVAVGGVVGLAGCVSSDSGDNGGGDSGSAQSVEWRHGTGFSKAGNNKDAIDPSHLWELSRRLEKKTDGRLSIQVIGQGEICGFSDCGEKLQAGVVNSASSSPANSYKQFPPLHFWVMPYLFPGDNIASINATMFSKQVWEEYWVPFGKQYGVVPFMPEEGQFRCVFIATDAANKVGERIRLPKQIEGLDIRRTFSRMSAQALRSWGANPVELAFADTLQGLQTGVVQGMEIWPTAHAAFGMAEATGQAIINNWAMGIEPNWIRVDFLQQLSRNDLQLLGEETKKLSEEWVRMTNEFNTQRAGVADPPTPGSKYDEEGVTVNILDDELAEWQGDLDLKDNPEQYSQVYTETERLNAINDGEAFINMIYDKARSSSTPTSTEGFSYDAWWHDYANELL